MLLFRHGGKTSSIPPPSGRLMAVVVVVARRRKEHHVVAAVEGHELETPETEQRPGLERLLETTHWEHLEGGWIGDPIKLKLIATKNLIRR
jgi:hypothetical protein